jgi:hypothetical protein
LDLSQIVADAAHKQGFVAMDGVRDGDPDNPNADAGVRAIVIARKPERLAGYDKPVWTLMVPNKNPEPWTDDHTDILRALMDR